MREFFEREKELVYIKEIERLSALMVEHIRRNSFDGAHRCCLEIKKHIITLKANEKKKRAHYKKLRQEVRSKDYAKVYSEYVQKIKDLK